MSRYYSAAQYEQDYLPKRLNNWQTTPTTDAKYGTAASRYSTLQQPAKARNMAFMVDDKGHLKPGIKKINNSFRVRLGPADSAPTRWPKPCIFSKQAPAATMGYKGSQPCCETGKPVYDGIVTTRLQRKAGAADGSRAGTAN